MNPLIFNKEEKKYIDTTTGNGGELSSLALVLHGRSVVLNPLKDVYRMELMDRMMFCIGLAYNQEPLSMQELSGCLPKSFTKMMTNLSQLFSQLVLMDEEGKEELMPRFEEAMNGRLREIIEGRKQLYLLAGVDSENELNHKLKLIADFKQKAETIYFSQEGTIERKRSIDEAMLTLSPLHHCLHHSEIINNYWQMISKTSEGYLTHERVENRIFSLFFENLFESMGSAFPNNSESEQFPKNRREFAKLLINKLQNGLQEILLKLQEELSEAATNEEALQLGYLLLKGTLIAPTLTKVIIRQQLMKLLEDVEREVQFWIPFSKETQEKHIAYAKKRIAETHAKINEYEEKISGEEIPHTLEEIIGSDHYFEKSQLVIKKKYLENLQELLREAEEKDIYSMACSFASEDPRKLEKLIPDLTPYDQLILKVYPFDGHSDSKEDPDLEINLSNLKDPLAYFIEVYKSKDEEILGFFMGDRKRFTLL